MLSEGLEIASSDSRDKNTTCVIHGVVSSDHRHRLKPSMAAALMKSGQLDQSRYDMFTNKEIDLFLCCGHFLPAHPRRIGPRMVAQWLSPTWMSRADSWPLTRVSPTKRPRCAELEVEFEPVSECPTCRDPILLRPSSIEQHFGDVFGFFPPKDVHEQFLRKMIAVFADLHQKWDTQMAEQRCNFIREQEKIEHNLHLAQQQIESLTSKLQVFGFVFIREIRALNYYFCK